MEGLDGLLHTPGRGGVSRDGEVHTAPPGTRGVRKYLPDGVFRRDRTIGMPQSAAALPKGAREIAQAPSHPYYRLAPGLQRDRGSPGRTLVVDHLGIPCRTSNKHGRIPRMLGTAYHPNMRKVAWVHLRGKGRALATARDLLPQALQNPQTSAPRRVVPRSWRIRRGGCRYASYEAGAWV